MLAACEMSGRVRDAFAARGWEAWSADLLPSESPVALATGNYLGRGYRARRLQHDGQPLNQNAAHYQGDVRDLFKWAHPVNAGRAAECGQRMCVAPKYPLWDLVIAFPPCTHLSLAGARYWKAKQQPRYDEYGNALPSLQEEAASFFTEMTKAPAPHVAVENPVGIMGRKENPLYRVPDQVAQPWMFGDPLVKKTCLWLKSLPRLGPTHNVEDYPELERVATGGGSYRVDLRVKGRAMRDIVRSRTPHGLARAMAAQWGDFIEKDSREERNDRAAGAA